MYTAWSIVNQVKSSMSISVSQTNLQYVSLFIILKEYKNDYMYDPSTKKRIDWLSLATLLKVLFAISGVFSWFSHVAGNI